MPEKIMRHVLEHVARNATQEELRRNAKSGLCLHMLAAKLTDQNVEVAYSNKWEMNSEDDVTVTLKPKDRQRFNTSDCTVSRYVFERLIVEIFSRKIQVGTLGVSEWVKFKSRINGKNKSKTVQQSTAPSRYSPTGSSMSFF